MIGMGGAARYSLSSTRQLAIHLPCFYTCSAFGPSLRAFLLSFAEAFCSEKFPHAHAITTISCAFSYRILLLFSPSLETNLLLNDVEATGMKRLPDFLWRECLSEVLPTLYWTIFLSIRLAWKWQEPPLRLQLLL